MRLRTYLKDDNPPVQRMTLSKFRALIRKMGLYVVLYPGSMSSNWDGTWWSASWSDGEHDQIKITAYKKYDGLRYCKQKATEAAYRERAERMDIKLTDFGE